MILPDPGQRSDPYGPSVSLYVQEGQLFAGSSSAASFRVKTPRFNHAHSPARTGFYSYSTVDSEMSAEATTNYLNQWY